MIHDPQVEVTCDNDRCRTSVYYSPSCTFNDYSGKSGQYDIKDKKIEKWLESDEEWIVVDGAHFCSQGCASTANGGAK